MLNFAMSPKALWLVEDVWVLPCVSHTLFLRLQSLHKYMAPALQLRKRRRQGAEKFLKVAELVIVRSRLHPQTVNRTRDLQGKVAPLPEVTPFLLIVYPDGQVQTHNMCKHQIGSTLIVYRSTLLRLVLRFKIYEISLILKEQNLHII